MSADFFQPGRTYAREHHASTVRFLVKLVDQSPDGTYRVAFGWRVEDGDVTWSPFDSDDFTGWVAITEAAPAPSPALAADTARRAQLLYAMANQGGHWKSGRVLRWYQQHGYEGLTVRDARHDLGALRDRGHIHQHDNAGVRFFTTSLIGDSRG
ncbi:hypothetical protein [Streptomyces sp. NPDC003730]